MKKFICCLLVGLMMFGSFTAVFAEASSENTNVNRKFAIREMAEGKRYDILKEFTDEIHQLNKIRMERHNLRAQVIEKQDQLLDLYIEARESGNDVALEAAKKEREQIKLIHEDIMALREQAQEAREGLRKVRRSNDVEEVRSYLEELIEIHTSINDKMQDKIEMLEKIIDILS